MMIRTKFPCTPLCRFLKAIRASTTNAFRADLALPTNDHLDTVTASTSRNASRPTTITTVRTDSKSIPALPQSLPRVPGYTPPRPPPIMRTPPLPRRPLIMRITHGVRFTLSHSSVDPRDTAILGSVTILVLRCSFLAIRLRNRASPHTDTTCGLTLDRQQTLTTQSCLLHQKITPRQVQVIPFNLARHHDSNGAQLSFTHSHQIRFIFASLHNLSVVFIGRRSSLRLR